MQAGFLNLNSGNGVAPTERANDVKAGAGLILQGLEPSAGTRLSGKLETDRDVSLELGHLAIEHVGPEPPLSDGIEGGAAENEIALNEFEVPNRAIFANVDLQHDHAVEALLHRHWRVLRVNPLDHKGTRDFFGNIGRLEIGGRRGRRRCLEAVRNDH